MPRFLLPPDAWTDHPKLTGDEARHLAQVLRIRRGDRITVFDGCGRSAIAEVIAVERDHVPLRLLESTHRPPIRPRITLTQAIPKGKHMEWIVQKAVELGVASIQPLVTDRTIVHPGDGKTEKWQRIALEACKQCGQDHLPAIAEPTGFHEWITTISTDRSTHIIASLAPGARPLREILREHRETTDITLLVGPEGDFAPNETKAAIDAGFLPATLGSIVLRVETAALFCLSAVRYEFGR
jgi:16S rRNA (uracil1498-N3)-methyltransferase